MEELELYDDTNLNDKELYKRILQLKKYINIIDGNNKVFTSTKKDIDDIVIENAMLDEKEKTLKK